MAPAPDLAAAEVRERRSFGFLDSHPAEGYGFGPLARHHTKPRPGPNPAPGPPRAIRPAASSVLSWPALVAAVALVILTVTAYWGVGHHAFVPLDDQGYVYENPHVTAGLTAAGLRWALTTGDQANWHPLTWLSHMLDVQLFGLDAGYHHLTSLALHTLNTLLLFFLLARTTGALGRSACVAALFAVHPLHVESVAWIAERKDVLSTFFWLVTMAAYVLVRPRTRTRALRGRNRRPGARVAEQADARDPAVRPPAARRVAARALPACGRPVRRQRRRRPSGAGARRRASSSARRFRCLFLLRARA